MPKILRY